MSEFDDDLVRTAFRDFAADARPLMPQPDRAGVRTIARRHRTERLVTVALAVCLLLVLPVAAFAVLRDDRTASVVPGESESPTPDATPVATPSVTPSATPSVPPPTNGRLTIEQLKSAELTLPAWGAGTFEGCPAGKVRLSTRPATGGPSVNIVRVLYVDVDRDGADETVAQLWCGLQGGHSQVVAFDLAASGSVVTIGQIVANGEQMPTKAVRDLRADGDGAVGVQVGERATCCGDDPRTVAHQWRSFRWNGQRFVQIAGETTFPPPPPTPPAIAAKFKVTTTVTTMTLGKPSNGVRRGTVTVTVRNTGPIAAPGVWIEAGMNWPQAGALPATVQVQISSATGCELWTVVPFDQSFACHSGALEVNQSRSYTITFTSPTANDQVLSSTTWRVFAGPEKYGRLSINAMDFAEDNMVYGPIARA